MGSGYATCRRHVQGGYRKMLLDLEHLMRLRLVVARVGEMDCARWWNTRAQLGRPGAMAIARGMPRSHRFARARSVFSVAAARCRDYYDPARTVTLWRLSPKLEDEFDACWADWITDHLSWMPFFELIEPWQGSNIIVALEAAGLLPVCIKNKLEHLRIDDNGRGILLPSEGLNDESLTLMAAAFSFGIPGELVVPYVRIKA